MDAYEKNTRLKKHDATNTTTRMEDASGSGSSITVNIIRRITASPRQVKTQIAKLSYSAKGDLKCATKKKPTTPKESENAECVNTQQEFDKMKDERDKEIKEIQHMLNEYTKSPKKLETGPKTVEQTKNVHVETTNTTGTKTFRRSTTELLLEHPKTEDTILRREHTRSDALRRRSKSSQPPATKSHELLPENTKRPEIKKRSYNKEEARRFMEEQKKKRRSNQASAALLHTNRNKTALEKEEIKKRLAELHKNTRKILSKNLKKKGTMHVVRVQTGVEITGEAQQQDCSDYSKGKTLETTLEKTETARSDNSQIVNPKNKRLEMNELDMNLPKDEKRTNPARIQIPNKLNAVINPLMENQKRIGLLRKTDMKDHSFSAIKEFSFDKENVALDMMTPQLTGALESRITDKLLPNGETKYAHEAMQQMYLASTSPVVAVPPHDCQLTVPSARLNKPSIFRLEKCKQVQTKDMNTPLSAAGSKYKESEVEAHIHLAKARTDLPYWLKPSAVQIYPYNFIMAVRRKLEAIANPTPTQLPKVVPSTSNKTTSIASDFDGCEAKKSYKTPLTSLPKEGVIKAQQNVKRRIVDDSTEESDDSFATHTIENSSTDKNLHIPEERAPQSRKENSMTKSAQLLSEFNSNFSSISIQLPSSNTISEVSSLKSESVRHLCSRDRKSRTIAEDDTTAPSSIFNSPEKRVQKKSAQAAGDYEFVTPAPVSPLSLDRIECLKVTSKSNLKKAIAAKHINTERGDNLNSSKLSLKPALKQEHTNEENGQTFNQLLDDFNRSLSQVIQVNEQLKSTIDKSHKIFTPKSDATAPQQGLAAEKETSEYSTDFEEFSEMEANKEIARIKEVTTIKNSEESQKAVQKHKKHLFELENVVKPLLISPKSGVYSGGSNTCKQVVMQPVLAQMDINLESVTNSSVNSTESLERESAVLKTDEPSPQEFEKRLQVIEQLKINLRQSILNSKANRNDSHVEEYKNISKHKSHRSKTLNAASIDTANEPKIKSPSKSALNSSASSSQQYHSDSDTKSLTKAQKFPIHHNDKISKSVHKLKSSDLDYDKTISEDVQSEYESPSKDNNNRNYKSLKRTPTSERTNKKEVAAAFKKSHLNSARGDRHNFPDTSKNNHTNNDSISNSTSLIAPPSYHGTNGMQTGKPKAVNKSETSSRGTQGIGSEIVAIFNQSELELSILSASESSISYSSVGLYEKLIQTETTKSEHLTALLKMREKALLDRTKGQIAWLEVQKERYKAKGLLMQITAIKKKQRAILLKMDKEREEIKRLLQSTTSTTSTHSSKQRPLEEAAVAELQSQETLSKCKQDHNQNFSTYTHKIQSKPLGATAPSPLFRSNPQALPKSARCCSPLQQQHHQHRTVAVAAIRSAPIVRGNYELEPSRSLEVLLQKREADLQRRREHVTRLMKWHQRLDQEEAEVLQLEHMLLNCNNVHVQQQHQHQRQQQGSTTAISASVSKDKEEAEEKEEETNHYNQQLQHGKLALSHTQQQISQAASGKMERRIKEIDQSLQELNSINTTSNSTVATTTSSINTDENGYVFAAAAASGVSGAFNTDEEAVIDFVRTTGSKLNKLWRRLTSQQIEKFEPSRRYKLCKSDLARLYEEAKIAVLTDFANDERTTAELLEKSTSNLSNSTNIESRAKNITNAADTVAGGGKMAVIHVPKLNLNFSSEQSEQEEVGNYSPSAAEEDFHMRTTAIASKSGGSSGSTSELASSSLPSELDDGSSVNLADMKSREKTIEQNMQKFLSLREGFAVENLKYQRSHSDSEIDDQTPRNVAQEKCDSQRNAPVGHYRNTPPSKCDIATAADTSPPPTSADTLQGLKSLKSLSPSSTPQQVTSVISISTEFEGSNDDCSNIATPISSVSREKFFTGSRAQTEINSVSLQSIADSNIAKQICSAATKPESISEISHSGASQVSDIASESKAREISAKLEQISVAVSQLSQANSILTAATQSATTICEGALSVNDVETGTLTTNNNESQNLSTDISYSCHFENISTDMLSPSGCTLKGASSSLKSSHKIVIENSHAIGTAAESNNSAIFTTPTTNTSTQALLQSKTFESNNLTSSAATFITSAQSLQSKTYVCESQNRCSDLEAEENHVLDTYEADFEYSNDETLLEDISVPQFETMSDTTLNDNDDGDEVVSGEEAAEEEKITIMQIAANVENKLSSVSSAAPSALPTSSSTFPSPPPPPPALHVTSATPSAVATGNATDNGVQLMPDIINELEIRRCQQILLENENFKQYEHVTAVPYMYMREIPNKPPPPYVPPAHGSPMTTIFPSENRIKDITYRRTHELYCDLLDTDYINDNGEKLPSVMDEKITNIYERIILDICREYLTEHHEVLTQGDPTNFHSQLAFFNPPDRLRCIQASIYKEVRRCLAMDKTLPKRTQVYSVYGQRAKRDHIGKIIIQEMYDEDEKWCNFHREENEVLELIVEEMIGSNVQQLAREVLLAEGGAIEKEEEGIDKDAKNEEDVTDTKNTTLPSPDETGHQSTE